MPCFQPRTHLDLSCELDRRIAADAALTARMAVRLPRAVPFDGARPATIVRVALLIAALFCPTPFALALTAGSLKVEYIANPAGLDIREPRLSWSLAADARAQRQSAYQVIVASSADLLAAGRGDVWDTGKVKSRETFGIIYAGAELQRDTRYVWKVRVWDADDIPSDWSAAGSWQMGLLEQSDWTAKWIGAAEGGDSPLLRREFTIENDIAQATAYAFGFGWYRLHLNGAEVGDRVLTPVNSNYAKARFYDTYDVTPLLRRGANAIGLWLGNGYNQNYSKYGNRWLEPLAGIVQLELRFADGTTQTIGSDGHWKSAPSPIVANHIYDGETYDARRELPGWDAPDYDDRGWRAVELRTVKAGPLQSCLMPPIRVATTLRPRAVTERAPGVFVFDLGQNIAGWVRLRAAGPRGTRIVLRHAENLHPDGRLDPTTNRAALATDTLVLKGRGEETYEPRFTYHGFRYVEVTGFPGRPTLDSLEGRAIRAGADETGTFQCSEPLVNRIHENFRWSIANNLMGIPTDTATRDERTPCQMDSLAVEETAMHLFDLNAYYTKWLRDIRGDLGMPPNWTGDQVVLPALLHEHYGDRRILEQHFENMKHVVDAFAADAPEKEFWADGFGDWAAPNAAGDYRTSFSEGEIVNTAFFYRAAMLTAGAAELLGAQADASKYAKLAAGIRRHFNAKHFDAETHTYGSGRQATSILPLAFGLVPDEKRVAVARALHERIVGRDAEHLDTGIFGTRYLFDVLIDHGFADTAWTVLTQTTPPSYGHQIALGATTTWEQWSYRGGMQSHNHAMFSGPGVTLYTRFAGIRPALPGYRSIILRPVIPRGLTHVACSLQTVSGRIVSDWDAREGYVHRIEIPPNTTATVYVPAPDPDRVHEGETRAAAAPGVEFLREENGYSVFAVESGAYVFSVR